MADQLDAFLKFFGLVGAKAACPICGNEEWGVNDNLDAASAALWGTTGKNVRMEFTRVLFLYCKRCFCIRMHAKAPIEEAIEREDKNG